MLLNPEINQFEIIRQCVSSTGGLKIMQDKNVYALSSFIILSNNKDSYKYDYKKEQICIKAL